MREYEVSSHLHGRSSAGSAGYLDFCYVNFWYEKVGIENRHHIGVNNILWESDFPHPTCRWPNSQEFIARSLEGVPQDEQRKILVDNAVRVFNLTDN
jgi:hypothetical protein